MGNLVLYIFEKKKTRRIEKYFESNKYYAHY